ncbi:MAG: sigma-70 family RNA polymerase sigma factor [Bacteroidetes bacterium]|nr:sigma-70 family RNA polymerase sigma factor [Bacteroidota bacterium]
MSKVTSQQNNPRVERLLKQIRNDDPRAFAQLVKELEPFVIGSSLKVCRDRATAEENAQDTFVSMFRNLGQFSGTSKFSTWLYTIIVNNCRMKRRKSRLERASVSIDEMAASGGRHASDLEAAGSGAPADAQLLSEELRAVLGAAIENLPEDYRSVFVLRDVEHLSNEDVARDLDLSVAAVKSRLHRARERVREHVEAYMKEQE